LGVKRPGREADNSPPSCTEVKNAWRCTSKLHYVFMAWRLVKHIIIIIIIIIISIAHCMCKCDKGWRSLSVFYLSVRSCFMKLFVHNWLSVAVNSKFLQPV
jgi:hypothetical protein